MALSILPHLMTTSAKKNDVKNEIVILTATSGDTGKAALAGFADVEGTRIIVFYPKNGVSKVQELQMVTQRGENVNVVAIHGNFDNAQSGVKAMFEDKELAEELAKKGYQFSSANSINIGRLVPQVVYYVNAYAKLLENEEIEDGEKINVVVPTGNFGNILAAYENLQKLDIDIDLKDIYGNVLSEKVPVTYFKNGCIPISYGVSGRGDFALRLTLSAVPTDGMILLGGKDMSIFAANGKLVFDVKGIKAKSDTIIAGKDNVKVYALRERNGMIKLYIDGKLDCSGYDVRNAGADIAADEIKCGASVKNIEIFNRAFSFDEVKD